LYLYDMSLKLIVEKLERSNKKFIVAHELRLDCEKLSIDYLTTVKYLLRNKHLARIFKGIFYIYSVKERKLGSSDMDFYDILKEALKIKNVNNWYFGLETALKFNNLTHETFVVDFIINDKIFRASPILIVGRKVKFYKLVPRILSFGIVKNDLKYSDPEKTAIDLLYLKHYKKPEFEELIEKMSKAKLMRYAKKYPKKIQEMFV